jgi:hypothetical protein
MNAIFFQNLWLVAQKKIQTTNSATIEPHYSREPSAPIKNSRAQ